MRVNAGRMCELAASSAITEYLKSFCRLTTYVYPASTEEDIAGVDYFGSGDGVTRSFQVKHQAIAAKTGNYSFELIQKRVESGHTFSGNHYHGFEYYILSTDCRTFLVVPRATADKLFSVVSLRYGIVKAHDSAVTFRWNRSSTVAASAKSWTKEPTTALNALVPINYLRSLDGVVEVRGKIV